MYCTSYKWRSKIAFYFSCSKWWKQFRILSCLSQGLISTHRRKWPLSWWVSFLVKCSSLYSFGGSIFHRSAGTLVGVENVAHQNFCNKWLFAVLYVLCTEVRIFISIFRCEGTIFLLIVTVLRSFLLRGCGKWVLVKCWSELLFDGCRNLWKLSILSSCMSPSSIKFFREEVSIIYTYKTSHLKK